MAITKKDMEKLVAIINQEFGSPFLKEGMVTTANVVEEGDGVGAHFTIQIDGRYVKIDANLDAISSGSM